VKIEKHAAWSERAERGLNKTLGDERASIVADVNAGPLELWEIDGGQAWLITCVAESELAVCCVQGRGLVELADVLIKLSRAQGLKRIRWFTKRPAMKRLLRALPVKLAGYVFHIDIEALH